MILCCGEALIDMIPIEGGFAPHPGGAVFNTAIALGRLGARAGLLSGLSRDLFGRRLRAALDESHVDATHLMLSDRPTTLAFVQIVDGQASYAFYDENTAGRMIAPAELPAIAPEVTTLFFGGISLCAEPGAETYAALAMRECGARSVMLDPNIRPGFIEDPARYRARLQAMIAVADIVKVSDEDLDWIAPGPQDAMAKLATLKAAGPSLAILTRGARGATAILPGGGEVGVPAGKARVVDTVGAGDTFNAGVLASLAAQGRLGKSELAALDAGAAARALAHGAAAAAVTVSRAGADPPWAQDIAAGPASGGAGGA